MGEGAFAAGDARVAAETLLWLEQRGRPVVIGGPGGDGDLDLDGPPWP